MVLLYIGVRDVASRVDPRVMEARRE